MGWFSKYRRRKRRQRRDEAVAIAKVEELAEVREVTATTVAVVKDTETHDNQEADIISTPSGKEYSQNSKGVWVKANATGEDGATGAKGATGATGAAGAKGSQGIQGIPGIPGSAAAIASAYKHGGNNSNGYIRLSNGFTMQWVRVWTRGDRNDWFNWPTAYKESCHCAWLSYNSNYNNSDSYQGVYNLGRTRAVLADGNYYDKVVMIFSVGY